MSRQVNVSPQKSLRYDWFLCVFLTWAVPLGAALVSIDQDGKAEQAAVWGLRGEGAAAGFVEQDELVVDADVLSALIHNFSIRRLEGNKMRK